MLLKHYVHWCCTAGAAQSLKFAKMLSPLMLRLEPQTMKLSHYILPSNLYYQVYFVHYYRTTQLMSLYCWNLISSLTL